MLAKLYLLKHSATYLVFILIKIHMLFLFVHIPKLSAQNLDALINEGQRLYSKVNPILVLDEKNDYRFFNKTKIGTNKNVNTLEKELLQLQASQFLMDYGFVFKANTSYNFIAAFDPETNLTNLGRVNVELEWNLLKNGLFHNKIRAKQKCNEAYILNAANDEERKILWRRQFRIDFSYIYNKEALDLLKSFLKFEKDYFDFLNEMYHHKLIKKEPLIKVGGQLHVLENQIKNIEKERETIKDSVTKSIKQYKKLPLFFLALDSINLTKKNFVQESLLEENAVLSENAIQNLSLSIYASQNYLINTSKNTYFPSVGIRFKAPLRFNHRKKIIDKKLKLVRAKQRDKRVGRISSIITQTKAYEVKQKQVIQEYNKWEIIEERIRILKVIKAEYNSLETGMLILSLLEEQFKVHENIVKLKRQMLTILAHTYVLHQGDLANLIEPYFHERNFKPSQSLLLRSESKYDIGFQLQVIEAKLQEHIYIHINDEKAKLYLQKNGIKYQTTTQELITVEEFVDTEKKRIF